MKREFIIGGMLGMGFGLLGLLFIALLFTEGQFDRSTLFSDYAMLTTTVGLFFSFLLGGWLAIRVSKQKSTPILCGILSSVLTTTLTIIVLNIYYGMINQALFEEILGMTLATLFYSFVLGGIPMIILGSLFGFAIKNIIHPKTLAK